MSKLPYHHRHLIFFGIIALALCLLIYCEYRLYRLGNIHTSDRETILQLRSRITELSGNLSLTEYERDRLNSILAETEGKAAALESEKTELAGTVDTLQKLTTIDPELLKKYSKVYFLNEHYTPSSLTTIDPQFVSGEGRTLEIHTQVWPHLQQLLTDAETATIGLRVASAYRSFGTQANLKAAYKVTYGTTAANRFSADQGYSEHQLGTTVDFTTVKTGDLSSSFDKTPAFKWLTEHAHEYGFVLSYPKNNKYYIYEPWHWRYVGVLLATTIHNEGRYLYDVEQREIDQYLINLFD